MPAIAKRPESSHLVFRQRVPSDVADNVRGRTILINLPAIGVDPEVAVAVKIADTLKLSLRTRDPDVAKARQGAVVARLSHV